VLVELLADHSVALPPLNAVIARDMIERTRVRALLGAFRGMPAADLAALEAVLLRLSELACELPELVELDINPLLVSDRGAIALDARAAVRAPEPGAARYAHVAIEPYPAQLGRTLTLPSGETLTLRPIRPEDARIEQSFVRGLSAEARYFRFHQGLQELTPQMLVRFTQLDYDREMAFIAVLEQAGGERAVGVSRYVQNADGQSCEFALVVADAFQGQGIGTGLMRALIDHARGRGLARMAGEVLSENASMLELVAHLGFRIQRNAEARLRTVTLELDGRRDA
jgi:acetyltransferase